MRVFVILCTCYLLLISNSYYDDWLVMGHDSRGLRTSNSIIILVPCMKEQTRTTFISSTQLSIYIISVKVILPCTFYSRQKVNLCLCCLCRLSSLCPIYCAVCMCVKSRLSYRLVTLALAVYGHASLDSYSPPPPRGHVYYKVHRIML